MGLKNNFSIPELTGKNFHLLAKNLNPKNRHLKLPAKLFEKRKNIFEVQKNITVFLNSNSYKNIRTENI